ncbi:MAG: AAA family ATPase [Candidatus Bathyarchaeia archaeon]
MVRLLSLHAMNFKKLRLDDPVQFSNGITLIAGLNESGKSSVLDAILYALFGRVIRPPKARNEDLVRYGASEASVSLEFEVADRKFRVKRRLFKTKPTRATLDELTARGSVQPIAVGQERVNEEIVKLLGGITYHEIVSSTVVAQKELNKLIELNKDDRRKIINAFLNLESFNVVMADLAEERRDLEGTPNRPGRVPVGEEKLKVLKQELNEFRESEAERKKLLEQNVSLSESIKNLETKYADTSALCNTLSAYDSVLRKKENLSSQVDGKSKLLEEQKRRTERLRIELQGIEKDLSKFRDYGQSEPVLGKIQAKLEAAKASAAELTASERTWRTLDSEVRDLERKHSFVNETRFGKEVERAKKPIMPFTLASVVFFVAAISAFLVGAMLLAMALALAGMVPLGFAVSRMSARGSIVQHQSLIGDLRFLEGKRRDLKKAEDEHSRAKLSFVGAEAEMAQLCESLPPSQGGVFESNLNLGSLQAASMVLHASSQDKQTVNTLRAKQQAIQGELQKTPSSDDLIALEKLVHELEGELNSLSFPKLPDGVTFSPVLFTKTLTNRETLGRQMAGLQAELQQNQQRIRQLDDYIAEHGDIVSRVQAQEGAVKKLERHLQVVWRAVEGLQGTAESLRNRIRPNVQAYMGAILPALTSSRYKAAMLDENYNLQVWDPEAGEYKPRDVYSGGTEDQFLLAMRLAFALALLPEVKGQKPEFVFLDEPLGSSDEVRRSSILEYLAVDLSKKFKQIFIISHVGGLDEHIQNVITLEDGQVPPV